MASRGGHLQKLGSLWVPGSAGAAFDDLHDVREIPGEVGCDLSGLGTRVDTEKDLVAFGHGGAKETG